MLKNYFITIWRQIRKDKLFTFINIFGLALGISACLVIAQYVNFHSSFDKFYTNADRIFRLESTAYMHGIEEGRAIKTSSMHGQLLAERSPEIEKIGRAYAYNYANNTMIYDGGANKKIFEQTGIYFTETSMFDIFDLSFLYGSAEKLNEPFKVIMTEENASKFFDELDQAIGKKVTLSGNTKALELEVVGILKNPPRNTHLQFNVLISYETMDEITEARKQWANNSVFTYLLLTHPDAQDKVISQATAIYNENAREIMEQGGWKFEYLLQPLSSIHLESLNLADFTLGVDKKIIIGLSAIALIILVIAWINYINLSLAKTIERLKEVGVRMCMGSSKNQISILFLLEAFVMNMIAFGLALGLIQISAPYLENLTGLSINVLQDPKVILMLISLIITGSLITGSYPKVLLKAIKAVNVLVGKKGSIGGSRFRKALVFVQFVVTCFLVAGTITVYSQIQYMKHADLKIDIENIMVLQSPPGEIDSEDRDDLDKFKKLITALKQYPEISEITSGGEVPGEPINWGTNIKVKNSNQEVGVPVSLISMDTDYPQFFDIDVVAGRHLREGDSPWSKGDLVINEKLAEKLGFESPEDAIGANLEGFYTPLQVRGVLENHHHTSLHADYDPIAFIISGWTEYYFVKIKIPEGVENKAELFTKTVNNVKDSWDDIFVDYPLDYFFLDNYFNAQYSEDERFGKLFSGFSSLAIIIACLGLFGLTSFTIQQRTKEIGIRKVLGAKITNLTLLLSKEYLLLVGLACFIALPIAWYTMTSWLADYTFRITIGWWFFLIPVVFVIGMAFLSIIFKILNTIKANPIKSLRYE